MASEDDLTRNLSIIEYYKQQLESVDMQIQMLSSAIADHQRARLTVSQLKGAEKQATILIPAGGGVYLNGTVTAADTALVSIGAGYMMEKTSDDAVAKLDERIQKLQENQERLYAYAAKLQNEATELSQRTQQMMEEAQR